MNFTKMNVWGLWAQMIDKLFIFIFFLSPQIEFNDCIKKHTLTMNWAMFLDNNLIWNMIIPKYTTNASHTSTIICLTDFYYLIFTEK